MPVFARPGSIGTKDDGINPWRYPQNNDDNGSAPGRSPKPLEQNAEPDSTVKPALDFYGFRLNATDSAFAPTVTSSNNKIIFNHAYPAKP
jgi:hypothetical protein